MHYLSSDSGEIVSCLIVCVVELYDVQMSNCENQNIIS